ncbi:esterase/lipase family protein [Shewanella algae]|uniref:esterase/lipase family protein n=1 Tax=Shewanella algae TaxID=38313 RepID=UPI0031F483E0
MAQEPANLRLDNSKALVVLVHGFNKDERDMEFLAQGLARQYSILCPRLPTRFGSLQQAVATLRQALDKQNWQQYPRVHFVAHSMGGLIVRQLLAEQPPDNLGHSVFIATPHDGSPLASLADKLPGYSRLFQPLQSLLPGQRWASWREDSQAHLGIIAGSGTQDPLGTLIDGERRSDAISPHNQHRNPAPNHSEIHQQNHITRLRA